MSRTSQPTRGFTLVEMLVVMTIIAILAGMVMAALGGAVESGKVQRARSQIGKIDQIILAKWNEYRYRQVPIPRNANEAPLVTAQRRLYGLRELMRMELPDRMSDITDNPVMLRSRPSVSFAYKRVLDAAVGDPPSNIVNEQSECLYLILSQIRDGDESALNAFLPSEIGDTDGDGLYEILDPWGTPIRFLRWAPGYSIGTPDWSQPPYSQPAINDQYWPVTTQNVSEGVANDPFDPLKQDPRARNDALVQSLPHIKPFALVPLILSAGPDKGFDVVNGYFDGNFSYSKTKIAGTIPVPNDPYYIHLDANNGNKPLPWIGACTDTDSDGRLTYGDNISNHALKVEGE